MKEKYIEKDSTMPGQIEEYDGTTHHPLIELASKDLKDPEVAMNLIKANGAFLRLLPVKFRKSEKYIRTAIADDPFAIIYLNPDERRRYIQADKKVDRKQKDTRLTADVAHILALMEASNLTTIDDNFVPEQTGKNQISLEDTDNFIKSIDDLFIGLRF